MKNGNGISDKVFYGVVTLIIAGAIAYGGSFVVSTKEALAINKREHQIFEEISKDLSAIQKDVAFIKAILKERFPDQ